MVRLSLARVGGLVPIGIDTEILLSTLATISSTSSLVFPDRTFSGNVLETDSIELSPDGNLSSIGFLLTPEASSVS